MIEVRAATGRPRSGPRWTSGARSSSTSRASALEEDRDGRDDAALHLVAFLDGALVGTCRLLVSGDRVKLGRMVVKATARGRGIAGLLLAEADARARDLGASTIVLGAQLTATGVYERAGYERYGDVFDDAGHRPRDDAQGALGSRDARGPDRSAQRPAHDRRRRPRRPPGGGAEHDAAGPDRPGEGPVPRGPRGPHPARDLRGAPGRRRARHAGLARARGAEPVPGAGSRQPGAAALRQARPAPRAAGDAAVTRS